MSDQVLQKFIQEARAASTEIAIGAVTFPKGDLFQYGVEVGKFQGLNLALEILDTILRGDVDKEKRS